jgi:hypothetical protein
MAAPIRKARRAVRDWWSTARKIDNGTSVMVKSLARERAS